MLQSNLFAMNLSSWWSKGTCTFTNIAETNSSSEGAKHACVVELPTMNPVNKPHKKVVPVCVHTNACDGNGREGWDAPFIK